MERDLKIRMFGSRTQPYVYRRDLLIEQRGHDLSPLLLQKRQPGDRGLSRTLI